MQNKIQVRPINVLSLDGGGIRGLIPAMFLAAIEKRTGKSISELFDVISGTSTGGILALGLSKPEEPGNKEPAFKASDLVKLYEEKGDRIFSLSTFRKFRTLGGMAEEKYSAEGLEELLEEYFGNVRLKDALNEVLITSYDIENRTPFNFKRRLARIPNKPEYDFPMKEVARATSAAPTYFEPAKIPKIPTEKNKAEYWALVDGGLFANNPGLLAYTEALRGKGQENICMVSIGTGQMTQPFAYQDAKGWGAPQWVLPIIDIVFDGVSDSVDEILEDLLTYDHDYHRFQVELIGVDEAMDNVSNDNITALKKLANDAIYPKNEEGHPVLNEKLREACDRLLINKFYLLNAKDVGEACNISHQKANSLIKELELDKDKTLCHERIYTVTKRETGEKVEQSEKWYAPKIIEKVKASLKG